MKKHYSYIICTIVSIIILGVCQFVNPNLGYAQEENDLSDLTPSSNDERELIFVINIKGEIDARTKHRLDLGLNQAKEQKANRIIIHLDTYGGGLYDAEEMRDAILGIEQPIYVYVDRNAASAGALISIACDSIYMAPGSSIGAATVVNETGEAAPDKYQSYMKGIMRSTAEATGRNPEIAEAMVDQTLEIPGISPAGKVITFTTTEAIANKYCEASVNSIDEIITSRLNIKNYSLKKYKISSTDQVIDVFLNPFLSGILLLIIIGGIYFELQSPGVGFPILASIIAAILYFIPYYFTGLAENWEIGLFFVGLILIALEVFVIPGFGVAGIAGIITIVFSLAVVMLNNQDLDFTFVDSSEIWVAFLTVSLCSSVGVIASILLVPKVLKSKAFDGIAHGEEMKSELGYNSRGSRASILNQEGEAYTVLRPSGKIKIGDNLYDASSTGEYIEKGTKVIVISEEGSSVKVRSLSS